MYSFVLHCITHPPICSGFEMLLQCVTLRYNGFHCVTHPPTCSGLVSFGEKRSSLSSMLSLSKRLCERDEPFPFILSSDFDKPVD